MKILAIETSCDDTGIALIEAKKSSFKILANLLSSQVKLHQKYGGVHPSLAKREHQKNLPLLLKKIPLKGIDLIAITHGPGLDPCLWTGIEFARKLAKKLNVPLIPVNHLEGHLLISLFSQKNAFKIPSNAIFPAIGLIVSGGHTELVLIKRLGKYKILGETRDDAAGECFDKAARILGLPYPGGPHIAKLAKLSSKFKAHLPRPMMHSKDYDFSFSGLKTAVLYDYQSRSSRVRTSKEYIQAIAKEVQQAIIDVLIAKTTKAIEQYNAQSLILGGGVTANKELRKQLQKRIGEIGARFFVAPSNLCTDNALMIALAGFVHLKSKTKQYERIGAKPHLRLE